MKPRRWLNAALKEAAGEQAPLPFHRIARPVRAARNSLTVPRNATV